LLFELNSVMPGQRIEFALQRDAALVAAAQPVRQVVVSCAGLLATRRRATRPAQPEATPCAASVSAPVHPGHGLLRRQSTTPGGGNGDGARQFLAPRHQGAQRKLRFLQLPLQRALLLARFGRRRSAAIRGLPGMPLWLSTSCISSASNWPSAVILRSAAPRSWAFDFDHVGLGCWLRARACWSAS
jgi:hypothetical protein